MINIWSTDPAAIAVTWAEIENEYPDRSLIGIGAGHPQLDQPYTRPLQAMENYLNSLDGAEEPLPSDRRLLAALGPKMLELAKERSHGTHTLFTVIEHTRFAREHLGPGPLVIPEVFCVVDDNWERARSTAREYASWYLDLSNYTSSLLRVGFSEADLAKGGSDRLIDAVIPQGSAEDIAAVVHAHLEAGADHVCVQPIGVTGLPVREWTELAQALALRAVSVSTPECPVRELA